METIQYPKSHILFSEGETVSHLFLILKGSVLVSFPGGSYTLEKGDVIGVCDAASNTCLFRYTTQEDTTAVSYAFSGMDSLEGIFAAKADLAGLFCISAVRQLNCLLRSYSNSCLKCSTLYSTCHNDYTKYETLCRQHMAAPAALPLLSDFSPFDDDVMPENWVVSYYSGLAHMLGIGGAALYVKEPSAAIGLIGKASMDAMQMTDAYENMQDYLNSYYHLYFNTGGNDFFSLYTTLYFKISADHPDRGALLTDIKQMIALSDTPDFPKNQQMADRIAAFTDRLGAAADAGTSVASSVSASAGFMEHLQGSLDTILSWSEVEPDTAVAFKEAVIAWRQVTDPAAADDSVMKLRKKLTNLFFKVYQAAFLKSLGKTELPVPVRLLLYFGYADEILAGDHAAYLYTLADALSSVPHAPGIYTLYDWLTAVYNGEKEPSRNQYDEDYTDHVHSMKVTKKITEQQEKVLMADQKQKVLYELENMFPVVNKITYGRISTYCPVFTANQVIKPLSSCHVSPEAVTGALNKIRSLDFSAFYRETIYTNDENNIPRDFIHVECLPDFILMPNVGTRGVMWQEIEGRKRTTPSRMMLPLFLLEDIETILARLTGEYRWEMCKRVQGPRWNDISERSLTSEYFDYIQFYRKSHELSADAKERIRNALQKAKNSFKEMFIGDYMLWILYESAGSPRLNKISRNILFTYCPFSADVRKQLAGNPLYKELAEHYEIQIKRRLHHLDMLEQKFKNSGQPMPPELVKEQEYTRG